MLFYIIDLNSRESDYKSVFLRVNIRLLALKPRAPEDDSMAKKLWHYIKENTRLVVASDIKRVIYYFRNSHFRGLIKGYYTTLLY